MNEVEKLIQMAINMKATDLHISPNVAPQIRIDNNLMPIAGIPMPDSETIAEQVLQYVAPAERELHIANFKQLHDIDCGFNFESKARIRGNIYRTLGGTSIALRMLPAKRRTADELGISAPVRAVCNQRSGLFIVTGANGSGKTTTLAALIDIINATRKAHIITIEDPIEYVYESKLSLVSQREIHQHTPNFQSALRSALRENPDVVVLGEMRDLETVRAAVELAATGHLVLATMHTRGAIGSIDRLIGQFPPNEQAQIRMMTAETLVGILAQSLLPKKGGGLIAAYETLFVNNAVRNLIRESKVSQILTIMQTSQKDGMLTMEESLTRLVNTNVVSLRDAVSALADPHSFINHIKDSPHVSAKELLEFI